jgi:hypothetical protein
MEGRKEEKRKGDIIKGTNRNVEKEKVKLVNEKVEHRNASST